MKKLTKKQRNGIYKKALMIYDSIPVTSWKRKLCSVLCFARNGHVGYDSILYYKELGLFVPIDKDPQQLWYDNEKAWDGSQTNPENDNTRKAILMLCIEMTNPS